MNTDLSYLKELLRIIKSQGIDDKETVRKIIHAEASRTEREFFKEVEKENSIIRQRWVYICLAFFQSIIWSCVLVVAIYYKYDQMAALVTGFGAAQAAFLAVGYWLFPRQDVQAQDGGQDEGKRSVPDKAPVEKQTQTPEKV